MTLADLSSWMGVEALYDVLEMVAVDAHNQRLVSEHLARQRE